MDNLEDVTDLVKSIRNKCLIYLQIATPANLDLLPTILEGIYEDAQEIVEISCIKEA
jgi:hypothetical protein